MISRRLVFVSSVVATAISFFTLGVLHTRRSDAATEAAYEAKLEAIRNEVKSEIAHSPNQTPAKLAGTTGQDVTRAKVDSSEATVNGFDQAARAKMVTEIKSELQSEMGLLPVQLLRDRR